MKQNRTNSIRRLVQLIFDLLVLICIRIFQNELFYDPFISFFKANFHNQRIPDYDTFKLIMSLLLRYALNSFFTIWILHLLFKSASIIKFTSLLLGVFFIVFTSLFFLMLHNDSNPNYLLLFYTRRFLIQPLFLFLFVPAFYYQKILK